MSPRGTLVLVCNSHIDPVWLWPWEEGLAATLATFRAAADLCDEFEAFVFCHNEALLYQWVEEYEPSLFARIRRLVGEGRWRVMGGWYLQPDCNLPSGESLVRQVLVGRRYFAEKLGVEPDVAVNLDSFGHTRGLVQILARSGYSGYLFCRPDAAWLPLPADDFAWVGYDGSTIAAHRALEHYNSHLGKARSKVERWLDAHGDGQDGLLLWGVGNHGGGPSREDLRAIADLQGTTARQIVHGGPEDYFERLEPIEHLPRHEGSLNPWAVGCYTSMATVKQAHARLERSYFAAEAAAAGAAVQGLLEYPCTELREALEDLLFCQFHDILPGEGVREVERQALDRLGHGQSIVDRLRARTFFALLGGEAPAAEGEHPIFVHNHHPYAADAVVVCEFQPPEPNTDAGTFWQPEITSSDGSIVPVQLEKESCNIQADQRKRIVFRARLAASAMTRFSCRLVAVPRTDGAGGGSGLLSDGASRRSEGLQPRQPVTAGFVVRDATADTHVEISAETGLLSRYRVAGADYLRGAAFRALVMRDTADPWGMKVRGFRDQAGEFRLMSPEAAARFAGVAAATLAPVRLIEAGPVRSVVEALFEFGRSALALRYKLPADGSEIEVEAQVSWFERDRLLKLSVPTPFADGSLRIQAAYGVEAAGPGGGELVGHRWCAVVSAGGDRVLSLVNDATYGLDFDAGDLRVSLLRAPAYAGHPVDDVTPIVRQDRFEPREDQGLHTFRFWLQAGTADRLPAVGREASIRTDPPPALCAFPSGSGRPAMAGLSLEDDVVQLGCAKISEDGRKLIVRLFEPTGAARRTRVTVPPLGVAFEASLRPFEIKTFALDLADRTVADVDLLEREVRR